MDMVMFCLVFRKWLIFCLVLFQLKDTHLAIAKIILNRNLWHCIKSISKRITGYWVLSFLHLAKGSIIVTMWYYLSVSFEVSIELPDKYQSL